MIKIIGGIFLSLIIGYVLVFGFAILSMSWDKQKSINKSYQTTYSPKDYNNTYIIFYREELERASRDFTHADTIYKRFESKIKRDLAVGCIRYFIKKEGSENWLNEGATHRASARNKAIRSEEDIENTKDNTDYMGHHFNTYDLGLARIIGEDILKMWEDDNSSVCERKTPIKEIYQEFAKRYTWQFPTSPCSAQSRGKLWFRTFKQYQPLITKRVEKEKIQKIEKKKIAIKTKKKERSKKREADIWKRAKSGQVPYGQLLGDEVNSRNSKGQTPLMIAVENDRSNMVSKLIDSGADIEAMDNHNKKAIDYLNKNTMHGKWIYSSLRIAEVVNKHKGEGKVVSMGHKHKGDQVSISIVGGDCSTWLVDAKCKELKRR